MQPRVTRPLFALCLATLLAHSLSAPPPHRHSPRHHVAKAHVRRQDRVHVHHHHHWARAAAAPASNTPYLLPTYQIAPVCQVPESVQVLNLSAANMTTRVWKGWGASLAWYANFLGSLPSAQTRPVLDLLFNRSKGLGLNIVRYNIPGGFDAAKSPQLKRTDALRWRGYTGFKSTDAGPYNWNADLNQRTILQGAKVRGADTFVAFSSSPPAYLTVSGDVSGNTKGAPNLRDDAIKKFADYLADVVQQFATAWNVTFQAIEPFNQPATRWKKGGLQEACTMASTQVVQLIPALAASLAAKKLTTKIAAFNEFPAKMPAWVDAMKPTASAAIGQLSALGYESTPATTSGHVFENAKDYAAAGSSAVREGKEIWVSEWGPDGASGSDLGLALYMSRQIISSVNLIKASAWLYWQPLDVSAAWTLLGVNWNASATVPLKYGRTKKYWALLHFTQAVPKGAVPVDVGSKNRCAFCVAAFFVPCKTQLVILGVNQAGTPQQLKFNLDGFKKAVGGTSSLRTVFRTSAKENLRASNATGVSVRLPLSVTLQPQSLTTVVITNVVSRTLSQNKCSFP